jgi:hypothetical protein
MQQFTTNQISYSPIFVELENFTRKLWVEQAMAKGRKLTITK